ncbi:MAG: ABC transporter ATP-binding protein [Caulobacterales bacterium]|nr:ABC transporter ATP-binding protein [Caulobacterales bacterium]
MSADAVVGGEIILRVDQLGKLYARRTSARRRRLAEVIGRVLAGRAAPEIGPLRPHEFWALQNVSFELRRGEALGVIGLNGSGKTTLLRILAGQILADSGEVWLRGATASMIDLSAGFQSSASGRENIYLRAAALGFNRRETEEIVPEVIAFSELDEAIDAPMASYSSGMKMRLAFSVMAMVAPDILFIDEVLAVGDFRFRQKCLAKIRELRERSAFVLVSHSMNDVARFCDRVIVLHKGRVHFMGAPDEAIEEYESLDSGTPAVSEPQQLARAMGPTFANEEVLRDVSHHWCDTSGREVTHAKFGEKLHLKISFTPTIDVRHLIMGVPVWNVNSHYTTGLSTEITSAENRAEAGRPTTYLLEIEAGYINPGVVKSMMTILDGAEFLYRRPNPDIVIDKPAHPTWGAVTLPHVWRRIDPSSPEGGEPALSERAG